MHSLKSKMGLVILGTVVLTACGGNAGNNTVSPDTGTPLTPLSGHQRHQLEKSEFESDCVVVQSGSQKAYLQAHLSFSENTATREPEFSEKITMYQDQDCLMSFTIAYSSGDYRLDNDGTRVLVNLEKAYLRPLSDGVADAFSQHRFCGFSDWKVNVERNVLDSACIKTRQEIRFIGVPDQSGDLGDLTVKECDSGRSTPDASCNTTLYHKI